jgi:hypothetical protein
MVFAFPLCLVLLYNIIVVSLVFNVSQSNNRSELSVPLQQIVGVYVRHGAELPLETQDKLQALFPPDIMIASIYNPRNVDMVKALFDYNFYKQHKAEYNRLYLSLLAKYPAEYIASFFQNSLGYWSPVNNNPDLVANKLFGIMQPIEDFSNERIPELLVARYPEGKVPKFADFADFSGNPLYPYYHFFAQGENAQKIPLFGIIYSFGLTFWVIVLLVAYVLYSMKRNKAQLVLLIPLGLLFFYYLTLFLGPVPVMRFIYPITLMLPFIMGIILLFTRKESL